MNPKRVFGSRNLLGSAGVHYVAACFQARDYHAAPTIRNAPTVDLLVSAANGRRHLAVQVKTAQDALRLKGRGGRKRPHHYEWPFSWSSLKGAARVPRKRFLFALVDMKGFPDGVPDVFLVPSRVLLRYYRDGLPKKWKWPRYHPSVAALRRYKNNWALVEEELRRA